VSATRPLRLLAYTDSLAVGGAELMLGYLLGALCPHIEIGVLTMDGGVAQAILSRRPEGRAMTVGVPRHGRDRVALLDHVRAVRAFAPDVIHSNHAWPWACSYGELAGFLTPRVRVIAVDHLPIPAAIPRSRRMVTRLLAGRLDAHVAVGERVARSIEEMVGLRAGSVDSVPNGVPVERVDPTTPVAPSPVIGSLGRLTEQKGYDLLVRALPELPGATAVLVGDGPERFTLEKLASELGVAERLVIIGWVPDARRYLSTFDIFALPSRWEGMPLGIIEAMQSGVPVVASDVGSVVEVVSHGETGYVVAPEDPHDLQDRLQSLLADPAMRRRMGERGRLVALERFTDVVMARRYEAIYREVTGSGG
jgi:glycosyltransferase involved in cell wall biosynthesis